jgi:hypothetical protein
MNLNADNLELMRLPDLWARYAQVVGEESRTPPNQPTGHSCSRSSREEPRSRPDEALASPLG